MAEKGWCLRWSPISGGEKKTEAVLRMRMFLFAGCSYSAAVFYVENLQIIAVNKVWSTLEKSKSIITGR